MNAPNKEKETGNKKYELISKNTVNNITIVKEKINKRDSLFQSIVIVPFHSYQFTNMQSVFAAWGELLNDHSNATIHKCAGTVQIISQRK